MRWKRKMEVQGNSRTITKFLFFPTKIFDFVTMHDDIRWLEKATILQEYRSTRSGGRWKNLRWVDKKDEIPF